MKVAFVSSLLLVTGSAVTQSWSGQQVTDAAATVPGVVGPTFQVRPTGTGPDLAAAGPTLMKGWPVKIPLYPSWNFAPSRGVCLADLNDDGRLELIRPSTDGKVYVFTHDGKSLPGWPQNTIGFAQYPPTVVDIDGDGRKEVVMSTRGVTSGGRLYAFSAAGKLRPGFPINLSGNNVSSSITAADLDGDGMLELIAQERAHPKGKVHVFKQNGKPFGASWPVTIDHVPTGTPAVADLDGDGKVEVVFMSYNSLYVTGADGKLRKGFPYDVSAKHKANFSYQSPALGDLDGDGSLEIVTACHKTGSGCYAFRADGTLLTGWPKSFGGSWTYSPPTLVDLDGNGSLDVLCGKSGGQRVNNQLFAWNGKGQALSGFPVRQAGAVQSPLVVADIDDDGVLEILYDSNLMDSTGKGWLHCVDAKGKVESGFPLQMMGNTHMNGASIGDVDGDGALELAVVTSRFDTNDRTGRVFLYKLPSTKQIGRIEWKGYHEGNARRGLVQESDRLALHGYAALGNLQRFELRAKGGNTFAIFSGQAVGLTAMPPLGVFRLDASKPFGIAFQATMPKSGRLVVPYTVPNDAKLRGLFVALQGIDVDYKAQTAKLRQLITVTIR